jgi:site-specific DNA recombinase
MPRRRGTAADALAPGSGPLTEPTVRVATYRRASTDEGNQPYSLDAQSMRLDAYVPGQPGWTVVADYVERASGKNVEGRPQLKRLQRDAADGKFDVVLVMRIDRWSRSLVDLLDTVDLLAGHGVAFHSATEHFDTSTPLGKLRLQMLGMFAEFERAPSSTRIKRGNAAKLASGIPLPSRNWYGLTVDKDSGRIVADENTIGVAQRIFDKYVHQ